MEGSIFVKKPIFSKVIYGSKVIPIKIPVEYSVRDQQTDSKIENKVNGIAKTILKRNKVRRLVQPDFKTFHKATIMNRACSSLCLQSIVHSHSVAKGQT